MNVIGYYGSALGLGETARGMLAALAARNVAAVPVHLRPFPGQRRVPGLEAVRPAAAPFAVNLFYTNGDGMRGFVREHGRTLLDGRYSIGVWPSELIPAPARWRLASRGLDEFWAYSDHVHEALVAVVDAPVLKVPQPVPLPLAGQATRANLGFPEGFVFHSMFDYASTIARKNPVGTVLAFRRAFAECSGAHLVIRSINARRYPAERRCLQRAAGDRRDIRIFDSYVDPERKNAMLTHCDCYVSLHRAEGFGLPVAEAMRLGKPVIATGWSGNLEFMTTANSYLVGYSMVQVGRGSWPYPADARWADPNIDEAAQRMREVFEHPGSAAARGRLAAEDLRRGHDPAAVGPIVEARLAAVRERIAGDRSADIDRHLAPH